MASKEAASTEPEAKKPRVHAANGACRFALGGVAPAPEPLPLIRERRSQGVGIKGRFELDPAGRDPALPETLQPPREGLPLLCRAEASTASCAAWGAEARGLLDEKLRSNPVMLLSGLPIETSEDFSEFVGGMDYPTVARHGVSERKSYAKSVFGASDDVPITACLAPHNEQAYLSRDGKPTYPRKLFFCCLQPPGSGGETPVTLNADVHKALDPEVLKKFEEHGVKYRQKLINAPRDSPMELNLGGRQSWQKLLETEGKAEAEEACKVRELSFRWLEGDELEITSATLPATLQEAPRTWFNQVNNPYSFQPLYGDGSAVDESVMEHVNTTMWRQTVAFRWSKGDVLCLDNELALHSRTSFEPPRKIVCAFSAI